MYIDEIIVLISGWVIQTMDTICYEIEYINRFNFMLINVPRIVNRSNNF